jgi:excisionase family DNA binding protein
LEDPAVAEIMTAKELATYLRLHKVTICKYASEGRIPATRIGPIWRFDKDAIDEWIAGGQDRQKSRKRKKSAEDQKQT